MLRISMIMIILGISNIWWLDSWVCSAFHPNVAIPINWMCAISTMPTSTGRQLSRHNEHLANCCRWPAQKSASQGGTHEAVADITYSSSFTDAVPTHKWGMRSSIGATDLQKVGAEWTGNVE